MGVHPLELNVYQKHLGDHLEKQQQCDANPDEPHHHWNKKYEDEEEDTLSRKLSKEQIPTTYRHLQLGATIPIGIQPFVAKFTDSAILKPVLKPKWTALGATMTLSPCLCITWNKDNNQ